MKKLTKIFIIMLLWVPTIVFAASDLNSEVKGEGKGERLTPAPSSSSSLSSSTSGIALTSEDLNSVYRMQFEAALLSVNALKSTHETLRKLESGSPTCFISYAWGSEAFNPIVQMIAEDLTRAGIVVKFDLWHNRAGTQISRFTEEISRVDFVVLAGSRTLVQKYTQSGPILNAELGQIFHKNKNKPESVIPIVFEGTNEDALPPYLIDAVYIGFQKREDYFKSCFELISRLYQLAHDDGPLRTITQNFYDTLRLMTTESTRSILEEYKRKKEESEKAKEALLRSGIGRTLTADLERREHALGDEGKKK
jgi:hypothetical protein